MIKKKTWKEFRSSGLLWFINRTLHLFGWAICMDVEKDKVLDVYPARVKFRGFGRIEEEKGFKNISKYLKENIKEIEKEAK